MTAAVELIYRSRDSPEHGDLTFAILPKLESRVADVTDWKYLRFDLLSKEGYVPPVCLSTPSEVAELIDYIVRNAWRDPYNTASPKDPCLLGNDFRPDENGYVWLRYNPKYIFGRLTYIVRDMNSLTLDWMMNRG